MATMRMMERLANADDTPRLDSTERALNKLARAFTAQVEVLKRYRTGGEQSPHGTMSRDLQMASILRSTIGCVNVPVQARGFLPEPM